MVYKKHLKISNKVIKQAKKRLEEKICKNIKHDPKAFYKYARQNMRIRECIPSMTMDDDDESYEDSKIAEILNT